jgi:hypothetical protein
MIIAAAVGIYLLALATTIPRARAVWPRPANANVAA